MKSSAKKVELASVDDLFSTEESRADAQREKVVEIPLSELHPFKGHPLLFLLPKMTSTMCCVWAAIQTVKGSVWLQPLKSRKPPLRLPRY